MATPKKMKKRAGSAPRNLGSGAAIRSGQGKVAAQAASMEAKAKDRKSSEKKTMNRLMKNSPVAEQKIADRAKKNF